MDNDLLDLLLAFSFVLLVLGALFLYLILSSHRRQQEATARKVLVQFADYMLANLMSPEDVTLIDCADEFRNIETYKEYQKIYLEASRLSARQNLTGENLTKVIEQAKTSAEKLRKESSKQGI